MYLYLYLYKSPCRQITEMKGIKGECREGWNSPVWGICSCSFLGASWVPCVRVHNRSHSGSIWLFIPWGLGFLCKCKGTFTALSLMSLPVWHLSIVIDGCASSDWLLGPMLMWVHLGLFCVLSSYVFVTSCVCMMHNVCIVLGLSLVFLVFCYMLTGRKGLSYLYYHNKWDRECTTQSFELGAVCCILTWRNTRCFRLSG